MKLYVYGYLNQIRSSRKLEKACVSNLEVIWLMKKLAPDFKTIADFRKDNIDYIKPVFKEFVYSCRSLRIKTSFMSLVVYLPIVIASVMASPI